MASPGVSNRDLSLDDERLFEGLGMRPQTPVPLTLEEHRELGAEMRAANARMRELCKVVVSVYGPHTKAAFTFRKVAEQMNTLCQELQAQAAKDLPGYSIDGLYL
jgi:hypothetical protein